MSEQELRDGLQLAVAEEPPMTFDLDELVSTAERLVRRRRALIAVGAGTAAVALAAVAIPVALGIARTEPQELPVAAPPSSVSAPQLSGVAKLEALGEQLRAHLRTKFPAIVPGAKDVDVREFGGEAEGSYFEGQRYLSGSVRFTVDGRRTAIIVEIHAPDDPAKVSRDCPGCDVRTQVDNSTVSLRTEQGDDMVIATHFRNDGTVVTVNTYGHDPTGITEGAAPKLSLDQLVSLAADPDLHF